MEIAGKVCVVTGGGNGIGEALCRRFAAEGAAAVVVVDRDADGAERVAESIGATAMTADVSRESDIARVVAETEASIGPIDLFCSNAGILCVDPTHAASTPDKEWERMWHVNVMAHVYAARALLPGMVERGSGYFLQTASAAGLLNQIGSAPYSVTKHAAVSFAESLAIAHGDEGIGVSVLCPQAVQTDMLGGTDGGSAGLDGVVSPEHVADCAVEGIREERFLILPHPKVAEYARHRAENPERWLGGMRKLRRSFL